MKKKLTPKSIIVAALALILAVSMFGCSKDTTAAEDKTEKTVSTEKVETVQKKAEEPTAELLSNTNTENGTVETVDGAGLQDTEVPEDTTVEAQNPEVIEEVPEVVELFSAVNETVYATTTVNVRDTYSTSGNQLGSLTTAQSVTRTGIGTGEAAGWSRIEFNGKEAYVKSDYLSTIKVEVSTPSSSNSSSGNSKPSGGSSTPTSNPSSGGSSTTQTTPPPSTSTSSGVTDDNILGDVDDRLNAWLESQGSGGSYENYQNSYVPIITQP